jgi:hypothetical protein
MLVSFERGDLEFKIILILMIALFPALNKARQNFKIPCKTVETRSKM